MNLVERDLRRQRGDESSRIVSGSRQNPLVVEADVRALGSERACQRALATLPRPEQADDRRVGQRRGEGASNVAPIGWRNRRRAGRAGCVQLPVSIASSCRLSRRPDDYFVIVQLMVRDPSSCRSALARACRESPSASAPDGSEGDMAEWTMLGTYTICVRSQHRVRIGAGPTRARALRRVRTSHPHASRKAGALQGEPRVARLRGRDPPGGRHVRVWRTCFAQRFRRSPTASISR